MIPHTTYFGKKHSVSYFIIFRYICYMHIPDACQKNLDAKNMKYIFLRYNDEFKAYILFDLHTKKIIIN